MLQAEITALVRRGIREPSARKVSTALIESTTLNGVSVLAMKLREHAPKTLEGRVSLASTTNIFDFPDSSETINRVWDMGTTAGDITDVSDSTVCNVEIVAHGFSTGDIVTVHGVVGSVEANGTWPITKVDADNFTLDASVFAVTYSSGGKCFKEDSDFALIHRMPESEISLEDEDRWFLRNGQIVVDDIEFENDIIVKYVKSVSAITDIPTKYHVALAAFGIMQLIMLPSVEDPKFYDYNRSLKWQEQIWAIVLGDIKGGAKQSTESLNLNTMKRIKNYRI